MHNFSHIPENEKRLQWFLILQPLIEARLSRSFPESSSLLNILNEETKGAVNWIFIKNMIETALCHCKNGASILSRAKQIKTDHFPDHVIDEMWGELRAVRYLLNKGAINIQYNKKNNVDFFATFNGTIFGIEVTYINGRSFKTQQKTTLFCKILQSPLYNLNSHYLINLLKTKYHDKSIQVKKHKLSSSNAIILIITDLLEANEQILNHDKVNGMHPIDYFVNIV